MPLEVYRSKRNFKATPEPKGRVKKGKSGGLSFVIQKHAARHLHYDFRLELNGVLLSWAVPKGPSLDPRDKRLAVQTEDHPIEYGEFEGVIPAQAVRVRNRCSCGIAVSGYRKKTRTFGYKNGKLKFELRGEKLHGGWILVRSRGGSGYGDKAWLLIKEDDEFARRGPAARIVEDEPDSVASRRSIEEIAAEPDRVWHSNKSVAENVKAGAGRKKKLRLDLAKVKGARKKAIPALLEPQLATLVKEAPEGETWLHEMKYDGYRMLCRIEKGEARIYSRNGKEWTEAVRRDCPHGSPFAGRVCVDRWRGRRDGLTRAQQLSSAAERAFRAKRRSIALLRVRSSLPQWFRFARSSAD